ncbi:MAG: hypothetical protein AB7P40_30790, partial [Chloroflexota bacterium]
ASLTYLLVEQPFLVLKDRFRRTGGARRERQMLGAVGIAGGIGILGVIGSSLGFQVAFGAATSDRLSAYLPLEWARGPLPDDVTVATFVDSPRPVPGGDYVAATGRIRELPPDAVVLNHGQLLQLQPDGLAHRLVPQDGQTVRISNLGEWSSDRGRVSGLEMHYVNGAWSPSGRVPGQLVQWGFTDPGWRGAGFTIHPGNATATVMDRDVPEPFVRLTPGLRTPDGNIYDAQVRSGSPAATLDGAPLTVVARIRSSVDGLHANLSVYDYTSTDPAVPPDVSITRFQTSREWTTYTLRARRVVTPNPGDHWSLYVENLPPDGWVDVASLYAYVGVLP